MEDKDGILYIRIVSISAVIIVSQFIIIGITLIK